MRGFGLIILALSALVLAFLLKGPVSEIPIVVGVAWLGAIGSIVLGAVMLANKG